MGAFTVTLKRAIEITGGTVTIAEDGISRLVGGNVGLGYYSTFVPEHKDILTGKIVDHYWNRELGQESLDMFQLSMRRKLNEIMPIYNQLYKSALIEFEALSTINIHTVSANDSTQHTTNSGTNETISDSTNKSRSVQSETPQTQLSGSEDYATAAADVNGDAHATSNATEDATGNATAEATGDSTVTGYQGVASDLIMRYRETFLNIDLMIINDLEDLFMLVYDNGDSYTNSGSRYLF